MELKCVLDHLRSVLEHKTCLENTLGSHQESKTSDIYQADECLCMEDIITKKSSQGYRRLQTILHSTLVRSRSDE